MYEYTLKNHFRFGYDTNRWFCNRERPEDQFTAQFGRAEKKISSWREANIQACKAIRRHFDGPLWVLFSGGTDSEICIRSFFEAQIPIRVATLKFKNNLNTHDLQYVEKLKKQLGLDVTYFELDILDFFNSKEMYDIVDAIECVSPILACHLWLADQLDGVPIIAQGEPYLKKDIPSNYIAGESPYEKSPWRLVESERLCSLYKHFIFKNRPAVPGFFQYTPEQFYSYLTGNKILTDLVEDRVIGKLGTRTSKNDMAYQFYPEVEPRQKFTGFEYVENLHNLKRAELARRFPNSDQNYLIEYHELVRALAPFSEAQHENFI